MGASRSVSTTAASNDARTIFAFMATAVAIALVNVELYKRPIPVAGNLAAPITEPAKIILGGMVGTTGLVLLSHAGDPGRRFAVGLALATMITSILINGQPVFKALSSLQGTAGTPSKPSTPTKPSKTTAGK